MSKNKKIVIPSNEEVNKYGHKDNPPSEEKPPQAEQQVQPAEEPAKSQESPPSSETKSEAEEWKDKYLRTKADFLNYQRRAEKTLSESLRYANASLVKALLPILDDLERVIASETDQSAGTRAFIDGMKLTLDNFHKRLREFHIVPIEAAGKAFDPNVHEAVMEDASVEHPQRTVLKELTRGYQLHDRILRPARVAVSKQSETTEQTTDKQPEDTNAKGETQ